MLKVLFGFFFCLVLVLIDKVVILQMSKAVEVGDVIGTSGLKITISYRVHD